MNWNIIGHQKIISLLESGIQHNKLSHAYLWYGPKSIGKKTLVKQFILNLLCYNDDPNKEKIPCLDCDSCRQTQKGNNPDVIWLKKEADKKNITVEQIRDLEDKLLVHSFFKSYKIAIIENAEDMNLASANALLKTLEEPSKKTILILLAQKIDELPKTILSRTQKIKFLPVANKEIYQYLLSQKVEREHARELANLSNGLPGRALTFLNQPEVWQAYQQQLNNFFALLKTSRVNKFNFVKKFLSGKETLVEKNAKIIPILNLWQLILRDLILHKFALDDKIINIAGLRAMENINAKYNLEQIVSAQKRIEQTKKFLALNANPQLALENLLLNF